MTKTDANAATLVLPGPASPNGEQPRTAVRRIAICGTAPSTRNQVPFHEPGFEFWSLNDAWKVFPVRPGMAWFELHTREWFTGPNRPPDHLAWLQAQTIPIYMWEHYPDIPASVPYPIDQMCKLFPGATARWTLGPQGPQIQPQEGYLTSTIAYMAALAISQLQPGDELWFWGVDLAADTEYFRQRPGFEYLCGVAQGRGIKILLPSACPILKGPFYGRDDPRDAADDAARQMLEMVWQRTVQQKRAKEMESLVLQGRMQALEEMRAQWPSR